MTAPRLSVVLPTYRRPELLDRCLTALAASDLDDFEVVAVDDGSGDRTPEVLEQHRRRLPLVPVVLPRNGGPAGARNAALHRARSSLVLFLDDDVVVPPALLRQHVERHASAGDPQLAVLGRVEWHPSLEVTAFMRWLDRSGLQFAYDTWMREGPVDPPYAAFYTANLSMHRETVLAAGGFDERFPFPAYEDMELAYRLTERGLRMEHAPGLLAWHARSVDLATFRRRMAAVATSAALLRAAAPGFPLDDSALLARDRRRRERWRLAVRAAVLRREPERAEHYWAQIAHAYAAAAAGTG